MLTEGVHPVDPAAPHPILWGQLFLPHHLKDDSPTFHWRMADMIFGPDPKAAMAAPRGHAKTTIADLVCLLYGAAKEEFRYCLLVSDSSEQAELFLEDIRHECETNEELLTAYPGLTRGKIWSRTDLIFANGVRIQAVGAGMKLRGRKHHGQRPDLILVDDLENDELVASLPRRQKLRRWFRSVLLPALAPNGRIRVLGTILHSDALLARLLRNPRWTRRLWSALSDDGQQSLWPARFPPAMLLEEKQEAFEDGMLGVWYHERQNKAVADEESPFKTEDFRYFSELPPENPETIRRWTKTLYVDPAIGEKDRHDWTAYTVVYASHDGYWYVMDAFRRRDDPAALIKTIRELNAKHDFDAIGVEAVQYQKSIAFWLEQDDGSTDNLIIEKVVPDTDKRRRIMALQPFYRAHRIIHRQTLGARLETELLNLDAIDHDDLADSLAGHLFITIRPEPPRKRRKRFDSARDERAYRHRQEMKRQARLARLGIEDFDA
jgi:predicted phage terminase large subunit-like protein